MAGHYDNEHVNEFSLEPIRGGSGLHVKNFLPIIEGGAEQGNTMFLPGLAGDAHPTALFPIGTYPIPASGDNTGTLYPLADPLVPRQVNPALTVSPALDMPMRLAMPEVALPVPQSLPLMAPDMVAPDLPQLQPLQMLSARVPGAQDLSLPLPTAVLGFTPPEAPFLVPAAQAPLYMPDLIPLMAPQNAPVALPDIPGVDVSPVSLPGLDALAGPLATTTGTFLAAQPPLLLPIPAVPVELPAPPVLPPMPALPTPQIVAPAQPTAPDLTGQQTLERLANELRQAAAHLRDGHDALADRNTLRAPRPDPNTGRIAWDQQWGGGR